MRTLLSFATLTGIGGFDRIWRGRFSGGLAAELLVTLPKLWMRLSTAKETNRWLGPMTESVKAKLRAMATIEEDIECWVVPIGRNGNLPRIRMNGRGHTVLRASYLVHRGKVPSGRLVSIRCRNWLCIAPDHLLAVTKAQENVIQKAMGRWRRPMVHRVATARGCQPDDAVERGEAIRMAYHALHMPVTDIAAEHHMSVRMVYAVLNYDRWKPEAATRLGL